MRKFLLTQAFVLVSGAFCVSNSNQEDVRKNMEQFVLTKRKRSTSTVGGYTCNPGTGEDEARGSQIEVSLECIARPCFVLF
jgi:hypothetical protein